MDRALIYIRHPIPINHQTVPSYSLLPDNGGVACVNYHNDERNQHYLDAVTVKFETNFDVV